DGGGGESAEGSCRVRRLAGPGFRRAAMAGAGGGWWSCAAGAGRAGRGGPDGGGGVALVPWGGRPGIAGTRGPGRTGTVRVVGGALRTSTSPVRRGGVHPGPGSGRPLLSWAVFGAAEPFRGRERGDREP